MKNWAIACGKAIPPWEIQDALVSAVYAFAAPQPQVDDITLMLLSRMVGA